MLDEGRLVEGYWQLKAWFAAHAEASSTSKSSEWTHLQWHMLVFELAVGRVLEARVRYQEHIEPAVVAGLAPTDGPAGLWRLRLAGAPENFRSWQLVRTESLRQRSWESGPFAALHHLLALAGAHDVVGLDRFAKEEHAGASLARIAKGLKHYALGRYGYASLTLEGELTRADQFGGSNAQNQLLWSIAADARKRAAGLRLADFELWKSLQRETDKRWTSANDNLPT
jgi:hypothetical protein